MFIALQIKYRVMFIALQIKYRVFQQDIFLRIMFDVKMKSRIYICKNYSNPTQGMCT